MYKVLVVEDEFENAKIICRFFQERGWNTFHAETGLQAIEYHQAHSPDLIVTDIEMPHLNGLEMIEHIRRVDPSVPIIVMSAHAEREYLLKAIPMGLCEYLIKPFRLSALNDVLKKVFHIVNGRYMIDAGNSISYDIQRKTIVCGEKEIHLSSTEITLFELLLKNRSKLVTYSLINETLYYEDLSSINAIKCHIKNIRAKVPHLKIDTLHGMGYKLI